MNCNRCDAILHLINIRYIGTYLEEEGKLKIENVCNKCSDKIGEGMSLLERRASSQCYGEMVAFFKWDKITPWRPLSEDSKE